MTNFEKTTLTEKGMALLAREGLDITFTRVETGCGKYNQDEYVANRTSLKQKVQEFAISTAVKEADTLVEVKFEVSNVELTENYLFTEIGLYAKVPDTEEEVLYAVCYSTEENADKIKKYNGIFSCRIVISLLIEVAQGSVVAVAKGDQYALSEDLMKHINNTDDPHKTTERLRKLLENYAIGPDLEFSVVDGILNVTYDVKEG